jgi:FkbM family methyltransferase
MGLKSFSKKTITSFVKSLTVKQKAFLMKALSGNLSAREKLLLGQNNVFLSLENLLQYNYRPDYIIDVGAYIGDWSKEAMKVFPAASFILVEPLPDKKPILEKKFSNKPVEIYNILVGDKEREKVKFFAMETGSSVFEELSNIERKAIYLDMTTLDHIAEKKQLSGNVLLKLDAQGFELEILKGAGKLLNLVEVICMEVSYLNYNEGAPLAHEVIQYLHDLNFLVYDIPAFSRKTKDCALVQSDMVFLKANGSLRNKINNIKDGVNLFFSE